MKKGREQVEQKEAQYTVYSLVQTGKKNRLFTLVTDFRQLNYPTYYNFLSSGVHNCRL